MTELQMNIVCISGIISVGTLVYLWGMRCAYNFLGRIERGDGKL